MIAQLLLRLAARFNQKLKNDSLLAQCRGFAYWDLENLLLLPTARATNTSDII